MTQDRKKAHSVFDFIYADQEKIASLLAQLNDSGNLMSLSHEKSAGRGSGKSDRQEYSGSAAVISGSSTIGSNTSSQHEASVQRIYDPRWLNALNLIDELSSNNMINLDLNDAGFGDIILAKGQLRMKDLNSLRNVWKAPAVVAAMKAGNSQTADALNRQQRRAKAKSSPATNEKPTDLDMFLDLIALLPHSMQAIITNDETSWGLLDSAGLIGNPSDFALKFGGKIPGEWGMLGILEARPDSSEGPDGILNVSHLDQMSDALFMHLEPITRQLLGRPSEAFGVMPLLIFREVGTK